MRSRRARSRAVRHQLDPERQLLTRVVSDVSGIVEHEQISLDHACVSCALREDVLPTLERVARDPRWRSVIAHLPVGTLAAQVCAVLARDSRPARYLRIAATPTWSPSRDRPRRRRATWSAGWPGPARPSWTPAPTWIRSRSPDSCTGTVPPGPGWTRCAAVRCWCSPRSADGRWSSARRGRSTPRGCSTGSTRWAGAGREPRTRMLLTGVGTQPAHLEKAFEELLATDAELASAESWRLPYDGFEPWLGEIRDAA